ncbi:hypothetical protein [Streptomyces barringtoniae]|uniref:hypothetical protein n=1 Tax=Streptomyces barringtoniae TaxID=2892029 RepID=UPI001E3B4AA5|nr:hypothetical protein [Streptomyces barringtoniae]MCC5480299.1 hypothetical protein [Streptomyces barringtoniae]
MSAEPVMEHSSGAVRLAVHFHTAGIDPAGMGMGFHAAHKDSSTMARLSPESIRPPR